jgi:hypothetical protein
MKLIQTHLLLRAPLPSPLPAGERDGVRGNFIDCNGIYCVCIRMAS